MRVLSFGAPRAASRVLFFLTGDNMNIYTVTTLQENNGIIIDTRCVGYWPTMEEAMQAVKDNYGDMYESSYNWAIVECFGPGIYPHSSFEIWYSWSIAGRKYLLSAKPKVFEKVVNFGIG